MEDHSTQIRNSLIQQSLGKSEKSVTDQATKSLNLPAKFKVEKRNLSYADCHHEITKDVELIPPKPSESHQKQQRKSTKEDELVKYMSNLPSYLERGKNCQEKVLSVGVLDWSRLEKWNCNQKQVPEKSRRHSLSSTDSSTYFSAERSSLPTSRGQNSSPDRQRMHRPSLQYHLMSSPTEHHSQSVNPMKESGGKFPDIKDSWIKTVNEQKKFVMKDQPLSKNHVETKLGQCNKKDSGLKINPESISLGNSFNSQAQKCVQVKKKTREDTWDGRSIRKVEELKGEMLCTVDNGILQNKEAIVLLQPRDFPLGNQSGMLLHRRGSKETLEKKKEGASPSSFSNMEEENFLPAASSGVPHSCPLPHDIDRRLETQQSFKDAESINCLPQSSHSAPHLSKARISSLDDVILKETVELTNSSSKMASAQMDLKQNKVPSEKVRSTSPYRRLIIGMAKVSKSFSSKEGPSKPQPMHDSVKSVLEIASFGHGTSTSDDPNVTGRAKSSPLRRLLDPVLKPRSSNCRQSREQLQRGSMPADRASKSSNIPLDYLTTTQPGDIKQNSTNCPASNVSGSLKDKEYRTPGSQALLRVTIKNDQPLFTFAIDNECDILAATMKKLSTSRKDDYTCIYTFFSFQETKKKNGRWINHGGKGKSHDYVPNVVAQLKVSGSQFSNLSSQNHTEHAFTREFVLFSVNLREAEQQMSDFQPNDELAAIVVKFAKLARRISAKDGNETDDLSYAEGAGYNSVLSDLQNQPIVSSQSITTTTVILPSGAHSLPNKGGPSSLTQRWRSGGSCDCGGWDLGCKLRILTNKNEVSKKSSSSKGCSLVDKFELTQGGEDEEQTVFSLAPFKDGIYSVEFHSSLSILQAFSLCIAVLDGKTSSEVLESSNMFEGKTMLAQSDGTRVPKGNAEATARYFSYPPVSPVGRV